MRRSPRRYAFRRRRGPLDGEWMQSTIVVGDRKMQELLAIGLTLLLIALALAPILMMAIVAWASAKFEDLEEMQNGPGE